MNSKGMRYISFILFLILGNGICGQKILQLEIFKEVEAIKYREGEMITFKTKDFPKDWQEKRIDRILVDENVIIFEDGMISLSDVTHFRIYKNSAKMAGKTFQGFGAGWLLFGGIAHFASNNKFTWSTFIIGSTAMAIGWILDKFVSKRTLKMGKTANLRLLDISFPSPEEMLIKKAYP